jgi:hypothetical protein
MELSTELIATHQDLSETALHFLLHLVGCPQRARELLEHRIELPPFASDYPFALQPWPTFVDAAKLAEIHKATLGVSNLVRSIPERILAKDPESISAFYGVGSPTIAALLVDPPNGLESALTRCDFVDSPDGLKCMEINTSAFLGGWQTHYWAEMCNTNPVIVSFLREQGMVSHFRDPLRESLLWIVEDSSRRGLANAGDLNICIQISPRFPPSAQRDAYFNEIYSAVLAEAGGTLNGRILFCSPDQITARDGWLFKGNTRLHAMIEYLDQWTSKPVFRCFKAGTITLYNSPLARLLSDKRCLALLSQLESSDCFDSAEREIIRKYIPWTREVAEERVRYRDESVDLVDLLLSRREELVLKHSRGAGGQDVHLGRYTEGEAWNHLVRKAVASGSWLAQEYCGSRSYLYDHAGQGPRPHNLVWGFFAFGNSYGGSFLRMMPQDRGDGVINSARGASEGLVFEVRPAGAETF